MEDLMGNGELDGVEVREDEEEGHEVVAAPEAEFEFGKVAHNFEENHPIDGDGHVEAESEHDVVGLEAASFLFRGVAQVLSEDLVHEGEEGVDDEDECPGVILDDS
jgi:hypothetical protein